MNKPELPYKIRQALKDKDIMAMAARTFSIWRHTYYACWMRAKGLVAGKERTAEYYHLCCNQENQIRKHFGCLLSDSPVVKGREGRGEIENNLKLFEQFMLLAKERVELMMF